MIQAEKTPNVSSKIETFKGIRYKIFFKEKINAYDSGISTVHIERNLNSEIFEKMNIAEIEQYVKAVVSETLESWRFWYDEPI